MRQQVGTDPDHRVALRRPAVDSPNLNYARNHRLRRLGLRDGACLKRPVTERNRSQNSKEPLRPPVLKEWLRYFLICSKLTESFRLGKSAGNTEFEGTFLFCVEKLLEAIGTADRHPAITKGKPRKPTAIRNQLFAIDTASCFAFPTHIKAPVHDQWCPQPYRAAGLKPPGCGQTFRPGCRRRPQPPTNAGDDKTA